MRHKLFGPRAKRCQRVGLKAKRRKAQNRLHLGLCQRLRKRAPSIGKKGKRALPCDFRIKLAQRPRRSIARIGKALGPARLLRRIKRRKIIVAHIHLATHFQNIWRKGKLMRNARNRARICSDIFACRPVAARCGLHELAVFIPQRQAQTVNLGLRSKAQAGLGNPQKLRRARDKIVNIRVFKSIAQRKHRLRMRHFGKPVRRCSTDFRARAVRALQLGKTHFNRSVTLFQAVILGIRNLWRILGVIRRVGRSQRLGQPRKLVPRCGLGQSVNVLLCHTRPQVSRFVAAYMPQVCPLCQCAATQKKNSQPHVVNSRPN